ncbi:DUF1353 domain-containing protein [Mesorhizobium sp. ORM8.1]
MALGVPRFGIAAGLILGSSHFSVGASLPDPPPCAPCFVGALKLVENPSDTSGKTKVLADDIFFIDTDEFVWKAGKGDITDGASIPPLFKPIIGLSFESDYLPAAVIHDHYTDAAHRVRSWRDTARVFYQAMLVNGVDVVKAKTMYFAVYTFGPHWGALAQGISCGNRCVFSVPDQLSVTAGGTVVATGAKVEMSAGKVFAEEGADYADAHANELNEIQKKIGLSEVRGTPLSLKDLESLAVFNHGENVFLSHE